MLRLYLPRSLSGHWFQSGVGVAVGVEDELLGRALVEVLVAVQGSGPDQTISIPLKYVGGDEESAELRLLARLQEIGYKVKRGE
jgi:hypothetical protein